MKYESILIAALEAGPKTTRELIEHVVEETHHDWAEVESPVRYTLVRLKRAHDIDTFLPPAGRHQLWAIRRKEAAA